MVQRTVKRVQEKDTSIFSPISLVKVFLFWRFWQKCSQTLVP